MSQFKSVRALHDEVARRFGMTAKITEPGGDEVRVAFKDGTREENEASAYYGSKQDLGDCYSTAEHMHAVKNGFPIAPWSPFSHYADRHGVIQEKHWFKKPSTSRYRVGVSPIRLVRVTDLSELQTGDYVEKLCAHGSHRALLRVESINLKSFRGREAMNSYSPGQIWLITQATLSNPMKSVNFVLEAMSTERLRAIADQRRRLGEPT